MRVFAASIPEPSLSARSLLQFSEGSLVWGVPDSASSGGEDREEKEFEALTECILWNAHLDAASQHRIACAAFDVDTLALERAGEDSGEWSHRLTADVLTPVVAWLISEEGAHSCLESDYAPDVLWFDPAESAEASRFVAEAAI